MQDIAYYLHKEILGSPAWSWGVYLATVSASCAAVNWYDKHKDKIGKWTANKIILPAMNGSLKDELKNLNKESKGLENKL